MASLRVLGGATRSKTMEVVAAVEHRSFEHLKILFRLFRARLIRLILRMDRQREQRTDHETQKRFQVLLAGASPEERAEIG